MRLLLAALGISAALAQQTPPAHSAELEAIRAWARHYASDLPDYTCDQVTKRTTTATRRDTRRRTRPQVDVLEEQVSFVDHQEIYQLIAINGRPARGQDHSRLDGISSDGEFGSLLDNTFDPQSEASFRWEGRSTRDSRRVNGFYFVVPAEHGYGIVQGGDRATTVAYEGWIYADAKSSEVVRIEMNCIGIPRGFIYERVDLTLDLKATDVAGKRYMLPSHHHLHSRTNTMDYTNEADYKACRRFDVRSTVKFEDLQK
jgi:hypothetical protein